MTSILGEEEQVDRLEDDEFGERRGDELPPELSTPQLEAERPRDARPIPASRPAQARKAKRRWKKSSGLSRAE